MPANSLDPINSTSTIWPAKPTTGGGTGSGNVRTRNTPRDNSPKTPRERMAKEPRFNPYAAPQTIDRPMKASELPIAEFAESDGTRQLFPEQTTAALTGMVRRSHALCEVQVVWFLATVILGLVSAICFYAFVYGTNSSEEIIYGGMAAFGCALSLLRFFPGTTRNKSDRYFCIAMDWLLFTTTLGLGAWIMYEGSQGFTSKSGTRLKPSWLEFWLVLLSLPFLFYPGYYSLQSLKALFGGQLLFGPERLKHQDLITELAYRQESGIE